MPTGFTINPDFGVIYLLSDLYTPQQLLDDYIVAMGRACGQADALKRFDVKVVYVNHPPTLMARRFNAGNIGKNALLTCPVCGDITIDGQLVAEFVRCLFDFGQLDTGNRHIRIDDFLTRAQARQMQQTLDTPDLADKLDKVHRQATTVKTLPPSAIAQVDEERALAEAERIREEYLSVIGRLVINYVSLTHGDPHLLLGDMLTQASPLIFAPKSLSRLVIDSDLRMLLPDYDNAEVRLHSLSKALYILFLQHEQGIELRNLDDHIDELRDIYDIIMPERDPDATEAILNNLVDPLSGTLNQNLSRIKRFFKTIILDDNVAQQYYITGKRGAAYRISLPRNLVTVPRVFCGNY